MLLKSCWNDRWHIWTGKSNGSAWHFFGALCRTFEFKKKKKKWLSFFQWCLDAWREEILDIDQCSACTTFHVPWFIWAAQYLAQSVLIWREKNSVFFYFILRNRFFERMHRQIDHTFVCINAKILSTFKTQPKLSNNTNTSDTHPNLLDHRAEPHKMVIFRRRWLATKRTQI